MARDLFPDDRLVAGQAGLVLIVPPAGTTVEAYADEACTTRVLDLLAADAVTAISVLPVTGASLPLFYGPDGVTALFLRATGQTGAGFRVAPAVGAGGGGAVVSDASATVKGVLRLAGDLAGTALLPTVPGLAGKLDTAGLGTAVAGLGDTAFPALLARDTEVTAALTTKADLVGGVVPTAQIPALALTATAVVASQAAMLALTAGQVQPGDLAVRTDGAGTFILTAADPAVLGNWTRLNAPTDAVTSVNSQVGTVVLGKADVGLGSVDNTSDAGKPVSTAQATANNLRLLATANLSDVPTPATARTNLGLGTAATATTGIASGEVPVLGVGGRLAIARVASGTPTGALFVRDDGTLATPAGGGGGASGLPIITRPGAWQPSGYFTAANLTGQGWPIINRIYYTPHYLPPGKVITAIGHHVAAAGAAGVVIRLAILTDNNGLPGTVVEQSTVIGDTGGAKTLTLATPYISPGLFWVAAGPQGAGAPGSYLGSHIFAGPIGFVGAAWDATTGSAALYTDTGTALVSNPAATLDGTTARSPYTVVRVQ